jgi:hypothetical protein
MQEGTPGHDAQVARIFQLLGLVTYEGKSVEADRIFGVHHQL